MFFFFWLNQGATAFKAVEKLNIEQIQEDPNLRNSNPNTDRLQQANPQKPKQIPSVKQSSNQNKTYTKHPIKPLNNLQIHL